MTDGFECMMCVSVPLLFPSFPSELFLLLLLFHLSNHQQEGPHHIFQNLKVISSIWNPRELALMKQQHRSTMIQVSTARRTLAVLFVSTGNWFVLISQMQSNYFTAQCEINNIPIWWSVMGEFTVDADSPPPRWLLLEDTWCLVPLPHRWVSNSASFWRYIKLLAVVGHCGFDSAKSSHVDMCHCV